MATFNVVAFLEGVIPVQTITDFNTRNDAEKYAKHLRTMSPRHTFEVREAPKENK